MNYSLRKIVSFFAIAAVLFTQLAVSAYACPMLLKQFAMPMQMQMNGDSDQACDDMAMNQPALCQHYCEDSQQIVNDAQVDQPSITLASFFVINFTAMISSFEPSLIIAPSLHHATSPPLTIRNCCFRI